MFLEIKLLEKELLICYAVRAKAFEQ